MDDDDDNDEFRFNKGHLCQNGISTWNNKGFLRTPQPLHDTIDVIQGKNCIS